MESPINLIFTESERSKSPIAKLPNGKICLINYESPNCKFVKPGQSWDCEVINEDNRKVIVNPLTMTASEFETSAIMNEKLNKLKEKFQNY
ncbi:MAG: hypothetical protein K9H26_18415 [Prolixibacteraceae bacterium]|nr:hypothetical protein [Prolixibacteraceae bacterium]